MDITLNAGQQAAADKVLDFLIDPSKTEMIIEGPAGTGKSTLVRYVLKELSKQKLMLNLVMGKYAPILDNIFITATTHKAAHVIGQLSNQPPKTIHSHLQLQVTNDYKTGETRLKPGKGYGVKADQLILIDEASFIDENLLEWIRKSTSNCKILFIGDPFQLAPTKCRESIVFNSGIDSVRLTEVMRNEGTIEKLAGMYRDSVETGVFLPFIEDGTKVVHMRGPDFQKAIDQTFSQPNHNSKILAWSNGRVHQYNDYVRQLNGFTGSIQPGEELITNKPIIAKGKQHSTDSHVEVVNVVPSVVQEVQGHEVELSSELTLFVPNDQNDAKRLMKTYARTKNWHSYFNIKDNWGDLRPTYACTTHKSQGSTYDKVFIDLDDIGRCNIPSDVARLLYVAVSRASQQVILYGNLPEKYGGIAHAA